VSKPHPEWQAGEFPRGKKFLSPEGIYGESRGERENLKV
jgi:hypothetical protein